ncbi:hypothetical protein AYO36_08085 [Exiguobacterium sp. KKBO11]|uniref:hypothetical protein n=1 Tax=Exiguobacterium sp. KKBO11 TaxID=1805000 RepID=UPI0007D85375|nr:hypothetical protein [Exiguobacterium sp. KKBO11]OAI87476.1 hypothetical protein AYO36_08085 [Exiguobacterium sp. KKBO11]
MRSIKYVLLLGVICIVSLGFYVGQVLSFDKVKFIVETKKGDPNEDVVQNMQLRLSEWGQNPNEYNISMNGDVKQYNKSILSYLFNDESSWKDAPRSFQQFIWKNDTHVFSQDSVTYGINKLNNDELELQYWNALNNKLSSMTIKFPETQMNEKLRFSPFQRTEDMLLIDSSTLNKEIEREHIYQIDLTKKSMTKIKLPDALGKDDAIRSFYDGKMIVDQVKEVEGSEDFLSETVVKDGKQTKILKEFEEVYSSYAINGGKYFLGLDESSAQVSDKKRFEWQIYDFESHQSSSHSIQLDSIATDEAFSNRSVTVDRDYIYFAYRTKKDEVKSLVINPLTSEIVYEADIHKKGSKNELLLNSIITN